MSDSPDRLIEAEDEPQAQHLEPETDPKKTNSKLGAKFEETIKSNSLVKNWLVAVSAIFVLMFVLFGFVFWRGPHHQVTAANILLNSFGILLYSATSLLIGFGSIWIGSRIFGARGKHRNLAVVYPIAILPPTIAYVVPLILVTLFSASETPAQDSLTWPLYPIIAFLVGITFWMFTRLWCALRVVYQLKSSALVLILVMFIILQSLVPSKATRVLMPEAFSIPAGSMVPSLMVGDHIIIDSNAYGMRLPYVGYVFRTQKPEAGEIIVFYNPVDPDMEYVKRILAVGGDTVSVQKGQLLINDKSVQSDDVTNYSYEVVDEEGYFQSLVQCKMIQETVGRRTYPILHKSCISGAECFAFGSTNCMIEKGLCKSADFGPFTVPHDHVFVMGDNRDNSQDSRFFGAVPIESVKGKVLWRFWPFGRVGPLD